MNLNILVSYESIDLFISHDLSQQIIIQPYISIDNVTHIQDYLQRYIFIFLK